MPQDNHGRWRVDPDRSELWIYTDSESYGPGDEVTVMASSTIATKAVLSIFRDGPEPELVHETPPFTVSYHEAPPRSFATGCGWPVAVTFTIPETWPSAFYIIRAVCVGPAADAGLGRAGPALAEHFFTLRPTLNANAEPAKDRILLICSTNTWTSYNNWGGANHYESYETKGPVAHLSELGFKVPMRELMRGSPTLSNLRPFSPGHVTMPDDSKRLPYAAGQAPRERLNEGAGQTSSFGKGSFSEEVLNGQQKISGWALSTGWATYEKFFYNWAVEMGNYNVDVCSNRDLHRFGMKGGGLLDQYAVCACVGHDEYWSGTMRDNMEAWLDQGGRCARFAGNFYWQVRFEEDTDAPDEIKEKGNGLPKQICHKYAAPTTDPVMNTPDQKLLTFEWESPLIGRPGCETFGLNGSQGLYCRILTSNPSNPGGFTIYRPEHWALNGTELRYGDMLAGSSQEAVIFGFECDGLDYILDDGVPFPTGRDGANVDATCIIGIGLCDNSAFPGDLRLNAACRYGKTPEQIAGEGLSDEDIERAGRGSGMIVEFKRGNGRVFHVGSTEWVVGLQPRHNISLSDEIKVKSQAVDAITRNVLNRFLDPAPFDSDE